MWCCGGGWRDGAARTERVVVEAMQSLRDSHAVLDKRAALLRRNAHAQDAEMLALYRSLSSSSSPVNAAKPRLRTLFNLRRMHTRRAERIETISLRMQEQVALLEDGLTMRRSVAALRQGSAAGARMALSVTEVERILEDARTQQESVLEIGDAFTDFSTPVDEDELLEELRSLDCDFVAINSDGTTLTGVGDRVVGVSTMRRDDDDDDDDAAALSQLVVASTPLVAAAGIQRSALLAGVEIVRM